MNWSFQKVKIMLIHLFWLNRSDMKGRATGKSISWSSVLSENVSANIALVLTISIVYGKATVVISVY